MNVPFSAAADRNKDPILAELTRELKHATSVLEIGAGTGQHAQYFASKLPHIAWQPTEITENLATLQSCLQAHSPNNVLAPKPLNVNQSLWEFAPVDACYTCNTLHIMDEGSVESLFKGCGHVLKPAGNLYVYGPFKENGKHFAGSNVEFDAWLRERDPRSGIRDLQDLDSLASAYGFSTHRYTQMPANNLFVTWQKCE